MRDRRFKPALVLILAAALAIRLAAGLWWQSRLPGGEKFGFGDSDSYWELGRTIARGEPYQYGSPDAQVFRTPGYPLLLAPLFWFGGNEPPVEWAYALSALLGTGAVGGVYWFARLLFDERTGLLAAAIVAIYPGAISEGALVLSEAPFTLAILLQLGLWCKCLVGQASGLTSDTNTPDQKTFPRRAVGMAPYIFAAAAGVVAAIATLIRPSWLLFTPFAILVAIAFFPPRRRQLLIGLVMLGAFALTMSPWWIRNYRVTGHFVPTTLQTGASLYDGLNLRANGGSDMRFVEQFTTEQRRADAANRPAPGSDPFEYRLDKSMERAAIHWAKANPVRVLELAAIKFLRTWNVWPNEPGLRSWSLRLLVAATYLPLLILGVCGAVRFTCPHPRSTSSRQAGPLPEGEGEKAPLCGGFAYALCWLPAVYFSLLHMIFVGSIRYREPAMIALSVLAAGAICNWRRSTHGSHPAGFKQLTTDN
jgi:4-amino-4-deoxy-L-arabinose transferase-like glycosyltransferase